MLWHAKFNISQKFQKRIGKIEVLGQLMKESRKLQKEIKVFKIFETMLLKILSERKEQLSLRKIKRMQMLL